MKNSKKARTNLLIALLIGLLIVAYKSIFMSELETFDDANFTASARVQAVLGQVQAINFDLSVFDEPKMRSLKSIEVPLPQLPVGKKNPFAS